MVIHYVMRDLRGQNLKSLTSNISTTTNILQSIIEQKLFTIVSSLEESVNGRVLPRGEEVEVVGPSTKRGHLIVKNNQIVMDVPYHLLDLKVPMADK